MHVLYHNADPAAKREADDWLNQFQQTPEAWQVRRWLRGARARAPLAAVGPALTRTPPAPRARSPALAPAQTADQLLHTPMQEGSEVWYFAAQTIRTKIWNDFEQLPEAAHGSLRDSLLSHLTQRAEGAGHILTQLCLALACLAVRMASWEQPIHDVHARLGSATRAILEFLTVLPECALDSRLLVERGRRAAVRASLAAAAPHVYALLGHVQQGDAQGAHLERALRCFLSWFRLSAAEICRADQEAAEGGGADGAARAATRDAAVRELAAKAEPLVQLGTAQLLKPDDDCFEVAVDLSIELVRLLTGEGGGERDGSALGAGGDVALARQAHALAMLSQLLGPLGAQLQAHVASQDEDAARGLCRLFAEVGESCAPLLANVLGGTLPPAVAASIDPATARHAAELVQILLAASAHPTAHVAEVCLNCWYLLMQELTVRLDGERRGAAQLAWTGAYLQLSRALVRAMVLPDTSDGWSADAFDDFRSFRYVCGDALCDAAKVVGGGVLLGAIVEAVRSGLEQLEGGVWRPLDGALQAAKAVAAHVGAQQEEPVASMLAAIVRLPLSTAHHLLYTALLCASSYSAWLHAHPDKLGSVLLFASSCLQAGDAKVAPAACIGLKNICDSCSEELAAEPWASQLLSLVAQSAELPLKSVDRVELLQGCGYVYSLLPVPAVVRCLEALGSPMLSRLAQLCAEGAPAPPPSEVLSVLDQLVGLVRYCQVGVGEFDEFHPIANLLSAAWPVLCAVHARCGKDSRRAARGRTRAWRSTCSPCVLRSAAAAPSTRPPLTLSPAQPSAPPVPPAHTLRPPAPPDRAAARWSACAAWSSSPCARRAGTRARCCPRSSRRSPAGSRRTRTRASCMCCMCARQTSRATRRLLTRPSAVRAGCGARDHLAWRGPAIGLSSSCEPDAARSPPRCARCLSGHPPARPRSHLRPDERARGGAAAAHERGGRDGGGPARRAGRVPGRARGFLPTLDCDARALPLPAAALRLLAAARAARRAVRAPAAQQRVDGRHQVRRAPAPRAAQARGHGAGRARRARRHGRAAERASRGRAAARDRGRAARPARAALLDDAARDRGVRARAGRRVGGGRVRRAAASRAGRGRAHGHGHHPPQRV